MKIEEIRKWKMMILSSYWCTNYVVQLENMALKIVLIEFFFLIDLNKSNYIKHSQFLDLNDSFSNKTN